MKSYFFSYSLLLLLLSFSLLSCKEEEQVHPEVQTLPLIANSPTSVTLKGNVVARGTYNVVNYGFVYGYSSNLSETAGTKVVVGQDVPVGEYDKVITGLAPNSYYYDRNIYARAYITNEKGTVFGQVFSVTLPSPNVKGISPTSGKAGDRITITGDFYTSNASEVEVTFGGTKAKVVEATPSRIVVEVPTGITYGSYYSGTQIPVALKMGSQSYNVTSSFKVNPTPKDYAPKSGVVGTVITITGDNLPSYYSYSYGSIRAYLGQTEVSISSYSTGSFQITVPSNITSDKLPVSVVADGITTVLPGEFTVTPHTVTSISPASGLAGSSFTVYGSFAGASSYYSTNVSVKVGDTPATLSSVTSSQLTVSVPQGVLPGSHKVKVTLGPHTVEAPQQYEVLAPNVTTFSPTSGGIGKEVIINGTFIQGQYYNVYFGSTYTSGYSTSSTTLRTYVPPGVDAGSVPVSVQFGSTKIYATNEFSVVAPTISSFSPTAAVPGTVVTINVTGFTPSHYTTVRFGTVTTPVISYTESAIRAAVPSGVTGAMKISVVHNGQTIVSTDNFTVN